MTRQIVKRELAEAGSNNTNIMPSSRPRRKSMARTTSRMIEPETDVTMDDVDDGNLTTSYNGLPQTGSEYDTTRNLSPSACQYHSCHSGLTKYTDISAVNIKGSSEALHVESHRSRSTPSTVADDGVHIVGRRIKMLVQAINDLRKLGVDHLVYPLPEIVVVGDQSAGKSSLIGAIAGIQLPRNVGTCTRYVCF